jgi:hypothetical protein
MVRCLLLILLSACYTATPETLAEPSIQQEAPLIIALETFASCIGEIAPPTGFERASVAENSFTSWLRNCPLKPQGSPVLLHTGEQKYTQSLHYAVLDIDVGSKDLQQCADAVMRLRAEYLYQTHQAAKIAFNFTSGDRIPFAKWAEGKRPKVSGNTVSWVACASCDNTQGSFRKYLDVIFNYAGTASLEKELEATTLERVQAGDVFIQGGFPGHAMLVADVTMNEAGEKAFILAQSYMPAQSIHIVKNPKASDSPWFFASDVTDKLVTSEWTFTSDDLARFVE